ncbi:GbsR/MarR family transcriptional regulator [Sinomicrobium soli]|uniref:GbsR/MarR family transcriptional regulator n=1 Tax=Sinomicrobium sp. N-1-3-6 TaxID=2219864 RepID=UPI001F44D47D|nr:helix-turn-helix domain-containing protein [Sinomicrobium sp. N-1-3-6]
MQCEELENEKCSLIEEMGVFFERNETFSPLSARIFSMLVLSGERGVTFEELLERLEASKSSVSTNLHLLQSTGKITYFTKTGDRKRYFKTAPDQMLVRLDEKIEQWKKEKQLLEKVQSYKLKCVQYDPENDPNQVSMQFNQHYIRFADTMINNLLELRKNISNTLNQFK